MRGLRDWRIWIGAPALGVLAAAVVLSQLLTATGASAAEPLRGFGSCDELHQYFQAQSLERLRSEDGPFAVEAAVEEEAAEDSASAGSVPAPTTADVAVTRTEDAPSDGGEVSETGTNVQERGVDESDIIKTDGRYLYVLRPQSLLIARIVDDGPVEAVGRIRFDDWAQRQELLIGSGKAVVVRQLDSVESPVRIDFGSTPRPRWEPRVYRERSEALEIDLTNPASPRLLRELDLDGRFISARLVDGNARIVLHHRATMIWAYPWDFARADDAAEYNEKVAELSQLSHWFPLYGLQDYSSQSFESGFAVECTRAYAPMEGWQEDVSFMLSFDLERGLNDWGGLAVMSDQPTVYSSPGALYLAAPVNRWSDTAIHRFDIGDALSPSYFGSGSVRGRLLSQWAMSEHNGYLRVATTIRDRWPSVSNVFVLQGVASDPAPADANAPRGTLEQAGLVSGLGVTEDIFAVRMSGDVGYVVTFRQTDPLYVLDLSDPTDPRSVGELKIPGFSRYLHPLSGGLLLGIGRDADPQTGRERGLQASLFDVSDPANPEQIAVLPLGDDARSPVESDHRAFRYQNGVAWVPVGPNNWRFRNDHDGAFLGVRVSADGLTHESTLRVQGEARRALPVGGRIHLLSDEEIRTYTLPEGSDQGRLSFADEWDLRWLPIQPPEPE